MSVPYATLKDINQMAPGRLEGGSIGAYYNLPAHSSVRRLNEALSLVTDPSCFPEGMGRDYGTLTSFKAYVDTWRDALSLTTVTFAPMFPELLMEYDLDHLTIEGTDPDADVDPKDWTSDTRVQEVLFARATVVFAWQDTVLVRRKAWVRCKIIGWHPAINLPGYNPVKGLPYSSVNSWYRVNFKLRTDAAVKAAVEGNADVIEAAAQMDAALSAFMDAFETTSVLPPGASVPGNRFPVSKCWWVGNLPIFSKSHGTDGDDDPDDTSADEAARNAHDDFRLAAAEFRRATGAAIAQYTLSQFPG